MCSGLVSGQMQTLDYSSIPVGQQSVKALIAVGDVSKVQELRAAEDVIVGGGASSRSSPVLVEPEQLETERRAHTA